MSHRSLSKEDGQLCATPTEKATNTNTKPRRQPCVETTCPAMWAKCPKEWNTCPSLQHAQNTRFEILTGSQLFFVLIILFSFLLLSFRVEMFPLYPECGCILEVYNLFHCTPVYDWEISPKMR